MKHLLLIILGVVIATIGCNSSSGGQDQAVDTTQVKTEQKQSVLAIPDSVLELYSYKMTDGKERMFFELMGEYGLNLYTMTSTEGKPKKLELVYDRYHDGNNFLADGWWTPLYYKISPDGQSLYIVTRMNANSDGWVTEYQLFKIDCETLNTKLLAECAALEATEKGFTIAVARLTNPDTAEFTYQEVWVMHDQLLDWNGKTISTSKKEYSYKQMVNRFAIDAEGYHLVKGFQRHILDEN